MKQPIACLLRMLLPFSFLLGFVSCEEMHGSAGSSKTFNLYSVNQDIELGAEVEKRQLDEFRKQKIAYDTPESAETRERLRTILTSIMKVSDMPKLPYSLHYVEAPVVNAMCAPGGKVFVYKGLHDPKKGLLRFESDAEFAAVLGHEYAHATMRHVTRQVSRYQGFSFIGNLAGAVLGARGGEGVARVFGRLYSFGAMFYFPNYGRKYETEADLVGAKYMAKAGYDPRVAATLWQRASEKHKQERKVDETNILASHPASGDRAKRLNQEMPKLLPIYEAAVK